MAQLRANGATYKVSRKPDLFTALAVGRKISPLVASGVSELAPLFAAFSQNGLAAVSANTVDMLSKLLTPVSRELANMSNEDQRLIVNSCLALVDRKEDGKEGWAPIWNNESGRPMFDEINTDLVLSLKLVALVLNEVYARFLPASLSAFLGEAFN